MSLLQWRVEGRAEPVGWGALCLTGGHFCSSSGRDISSLHTCTHVRVCTHLYPAVSVASRPARATRRISPRPINDHEAHLYLPGRHSPSEVWDSHWDFEPSSLVLKHP